MFMRISGEKIHGFCLLTFPKELILVALFDGPPRPPAVVDTRVDLHAGEGHVSGQCLHLLVTQSLSQEVGHSANTASSILKLW